MKDEATTQVSVTKIVSFNHAWKLARDKFGPNSPITKMLRLQKSILQCGLLRSGDAFLKIDTDAEEEALFSVQLMTKVEINKKIKTDADHIPVRIVDELLLPAEIKSMAKNLQ